MTPLHPNRATRQRLTAEELAQSTATHAASLYRIMRTLASLGLFTEDATHRFSLTPLGEALKTGAPGSARATVLTLAGDWFTRGLDHLLYSVQTGKTGFEKVFGVHVFDWLANHPEEASLFSETMVGFHGAEPAAVAAAYDFSGFGTIVDVGGATGNLLTTILGKYPGPRDILFDIPHVVREAPGTDSGARIDGPRQDRIWQFLRECSHRRGCLSDLARHPQLERRPVSDNPR